MPVSSGPFSKAGGRPGHRHGSGQPILADEPVVTLYRIPAGPSAIRVSVAGRQARDLEDFSLRRRASTKGGVGRGSRRRWRSCSGPPMISAFVGPPRAKGRSVRNRQAVDRDARASAPPLLAGLCGWGGRRKKFVGAVRRRNRSPAASRVTSLPSIAAKSRPASAEPMALRPRGLARAGISQRLGKGGGVRLGWRSRSSPPPPPGSRPFDIGHCDRPVGGARDGRQHRRIGQRPQHTPCRCNRISDASIGAPRHRPSQPPVPDRYPGLPRGVAKGEEKGKRAHVTEG